MRLLKHLLGVAVTAAPPTSAAALGAELGGNSPSLLKEGMLVSGPVLGQARRKLSHARRREPIRCGAGEGFRKEFGAFPPTRLQKGAMAIGRRLPRNYFGRRVSGFLRSLLRRVGDQPVDLEVLGVRMRIHLDNNACERRLLVTPHFFDPAELEILKSRIKPGFRFVDLGANVGAYSLFVARRAGRKARILAIEPQPEILERLKTNIALNGFSIDVAPVAILEKEGEAELVVDSRNLGHTLVSREPKGQVGRRLLRVPAATLLQLVQSRGYSRIDCLKADIEGAEDRALMPFFSTAPRSLWPRLMILEHSPREWQIDLIGALRGLGYRLIGPARANAVLELVDGREGFGEAL